MHPETAPSVAIILLNYRGANDTLACLDSLLRSSRLFGRLMICDNASPDDSMAVLREGLQVREPQLAQACAAHGLARTALVQITNRAQLLTDETPPEAWVTLIDNQANWGFAGGNNVGIRLAMRDPSITHFWLLNNDTEVATDTLTQLLNAAAARPGIDLWGGTVLYHHAPDSVQAFAGGSFARRTAETRHIGAFEPRSAVPRGDHEIAEVEAELDYALGACMFATRSWIDAVGLLSEDYFLYYEELDWATRGRRLGLKLGYAPRALVLHKEGASIGTTPSGGSALSVLNLVRSRVIYARKFLPVRNAPGIGLRVLWQAVKYLLQWRFDVFTATLKGLVGGLSARIGDVP